MKREPKEKTTVSLRRSLASWLRKEATKRHTTVSAIIEECVADAVERSESSQIEALLRAALKAACAALTGGDPEAVKEAERRFVAEALADMRRLGRR
ncbi:MAG: hypothetical protein ACPLTR_08505 [Thermacetogeniaceae bacterium]